MAKPQMATPFTGNDSMYALPIQRYGGGNPSGGNEITKLANNTINFHAILNGI